MGGRDMQKRARKLKKIGVVAMLSTCIAFTNLNTSLLVNAESNEVINTNYEEIISTTEKEEQSVSENEGTTEIETESEPESEETTETETETETNSGEATKPETEDKIDENFQLETETESESKETTKPEDEEILDEEFLNEDENAIEAMAEEVYTVNGIDYNIADGIEYSNAYGTGYYFIDSKTLLVTSAGTATTSNNRDYPWYEINENIEKVIITSDAGSIGKYEFSGYRSLKNVIIEEGVTTIGIQAFRDCSSLQEVIIPDSVNTIGYSAFISCNNLTTFRIGNGIENIGSNAFSLSSSTDTTVYTDNKVVKNYNWAGDNRNITFIRLTPITDLDMVIPVNNMSFNIDVEKNFSSDAINIINNSNCDVDIFVKNISGEDNAVSIVPENTYTDEEWEAKTEFNNIAFMLNNIDLIKAYNNTTNDESKFINLGVINSVDDEIVGNNLKLQLTAKYPRSYDIDADLNMNYNLTFMFASKE